MSDPRIEANPVDDAAEASASAEALTQTIEEYVALLKYITSALAAADNRPEHQFLRAPGLPRNRN